MAVLKCKMCGGDLEFAEGSTVAVCEYCGIQQTVPTADNEKKLSLFARANKLRFACEFDKAAGVYESIVVDFPEEAEAYWGLILCKYGIEYIDDPATGKKIPTCHRSSFESVMDDSNFELVMENADPLARAVYRDEAKQIEELRKSIIEVSSKEEPYDIFICYKETAENGDRTIDSVIAQDVYDALVEKGYRIFFSRITLEDKLGQEYEPYIFAALNSAKVMLAFGTCYDYYNAVWVKNEWSRFLQLIAKGEKKTLIPCYKNIDAYDMPKEFAKLQAQDMGKVGAIQDLVRGIEKILPRQKESPAETVKETVVVQQPANTATTDSLLKRAFMYLEDGDWTNANSYCERILDIDPENAKAWLGKLMAELKVTRQENLATRLKPFDKLNNYQKAYRYADQSLRKSLDGYIAGINERNRIAELDKIYEEASVDLRRAQNKTPGQASNGTDIETYANSAFSKFSQIGNYKDAKALLERCKETIYNDGSALMRTASTEQQFQAAATAFRAIPEYENYKDCFELVRQCLENAETARKEHIYNEAAQFEKELELAHAIELYRSISDYKDSAAKANAAQIRLDELTAEAERQERLRIEENNRRLAAEIAEKERLQRRKKRRARTKKIVKALFIIAIIAAVLIGLYFLLRWIATVPTSVAMGSATTIIVVLAIICTIIWKVTTDGGCIVPLIVFTIILTLLFLLVIYGAHALFGTNDNYEEVGFETPEIVQTYSGTYVNGDAQLIIESCDVDGNISGTFEFLAHEETYGKYTVYGFINEKRSDNTLVITLRPGEWIEHPLGFIMLDAVNLEVTDDFTRITGGYDIDFTAGAWTYEIESEEDITSLPETP